VHFLTRMYALRRGLNEPLMRCKSITRAWRRALQLLPVVGCVACIPLPRQLYVPEGVGGYPRYTTCSTKGVPDSIEFDIEGIKLDVKVAAVTDGRNYIEVRFLVPKGKVVTLQDDKVAFLWPNNRPASYGVFEKISLVDGPIVNIHRPILQKHMIATRENMVGHRNFWLATYITPQPDGDFSVVLPPLAVNGAAVALPDVLFRKGPFALIAPINC
jgi:hypothetical protein